jgi:hypothetical protein
MLHSADRFVTRRLERAQREGELDAGLDAGALAELVVSAMLANSLRSRAGADRPWLERQADTLVARVLAS